MLKRNYRKLVAAVSAAAMIASLAAPMAMAEDTDVLAVSSEEMAELAASVALIENDFDSLEESVLISLQKEDQEPYTGIEGMNIHIGKSRNSADEETNASIKSGVGTDGSNALAITYASKASSALYVPRIEFSVPKIEDNYMIKLQVFPTEKQAATMSDSVDDSSAATGNAIDLGLVTGEWNDIEIYVTRSGRVVNVNNETLISDEVSMAPILWGQTKQNTTVDAGDLYIDNFSINSLVTLPTPIPTATPVPPHQPVIGDVYDFENYSEGTLVELGRTDPPPYEAVDGFRFYVGSRGEAGDAGTRAAIVSGGRNGSQALVISHARYADSNRGPRAELIKPEADEYAVTFYAKADETMNIVLSDSTTSNSGVVMEVPQDWTKVEILMFAGQRLIIIGGKYVELKTTKNLPVLWGTHAANTGSFYIDDYAITELTAQGATDAIATTLDITNVNNTVSLNDDDTYSFIEGFPVPSETCGAKVSWEAQESTDGGATWVATEELKVGKTAISVAAPSDEKLYKLVGTVNNNGLTATKEFILKYVKPENVVDTVLERLDITSELYAKDLVYYPEEGLYRAWGNFAAPISDWVTSIEWSSDNSSLIKVGPKGSMLVYPKENAQVTLTGAVSYNGETKTKDFIVDLGNYYTTTMRLVESELNTVTYSPIGTDSDKVTSITLNGEGTTTLSYDINLKTTSSTKGIAIEWKTSDADILTTAGKINVDNKDENEVTLTKKVTYSIDGVKILSDEKDYKINVQFDPKDVKPVAVELAKAYALATDESATEASVEDSTYYNIAMEMLYDRYVTRFDANCEENFDDIPTSIDSDFDLPTEGVFGSEITWTSSVTNLKINDEGEVDVTRPTNDKKAKLVATFTSGASVNAGAKEIDVTVEGKGGSGSSGGGKGSSSYGGGNTYLGSLGAAAATPAPSVVTTPEQDITVKGEFTDLDQASWAAVAINYLASKGIVSGRTSTTFDPNANITRAEFAKIIVGAFELPIGGASAGFADVPADAWYAPYVDTCFAAGIITGYDSTTFGPDDLVTRQDMAVMVMRAANLKGIVVEAINEKIDFADADEIAAYAVDAVATLQQGGVINGMTADTFAPTANATRAQAAKILYSLCFE